MLSLTKLTQLHLKRSQRAKSVRRGSTMPWQKLREPMEKKSGFRFFKKIISIWKLIYFFSEIFVSSRNSKNNLRFISAWWVWSAGWWSICQVMALGSLWLRQDYTCLFSKRTAINPPTLFLWHFYKGICFCKFKLTQHKNFHIPIIFLNPTKLYSRPGFFFPELFHKVRSWKPC